MKAVRSLDVPAVDAALVDAVTDAVIDVTEVEPGRAARAVGHDPGDFSALYLRYRAPLTKRAGRFLSDPRDVDEIVQETFLKVFLALPELETELAAVRFAHRVLANMCIDRYRSDSRRPGLLDLELVADHLADDLPADPLIRAEDAAIVRDALSRLTPEHRAALIKREIEEKSFSVIADEIGIPEHQVKHLLFRARRALRRILVGSSVDPTVDLTAGAVLDLTGRRLVAAAGSTAARGTAIVVVLLVAIGWVLGAGSAFPLGHGPSHGAVINGRPHFGLVGPSHTQPGSTAGTPRQTRHKAPTHRGAGQTSPPTGTTTNHGGPGAARSGHQPGVGFGHPSPPPSSPPTSPTSPPPTSPPTSPPPVVPPATPKFGVSGLVNSRHGTVQDQYRVVRGAGQYRSSATFVANTSAGLFQMAQVVDFSTSNCAVTVQTASLNPVIPIGQLGAGYATTGQPDVTIQPNGTGYDLTVSATAASLTTTGEGGLLAVTLEATYDSSLTQVTTEQVTLASIGAASQPPTPTSSPSPGPGGSDSLVHSDQILSIGRSGAGIDQ